MNMLTRIEFMYGMATSRAVATALHGLDLAAPRTGEYTDTWDNGFLVFLNYHACVLRLTAKDKLPGIEDPALLQPLFRRDAGALQFDIYPGLRNPVTPAHAMALAAQMEERGVRLWDQKALNCGYLPRLQGQDHLVPVVIDTCAVQRLSDDAAMVRNMIGLKTRMVNIAQNLPRIFRGHAAPSSPLPPVDETLQDRIFAPLKSAFAAAWPENNLPVMQKVNDAWKLCRHHHGRGTLCAGWLTDDMEKSGYKNAHQSSTAYARHWHGPSS